MVENRKLQFKESFFDDNQLVVVGVKHALLDCNSMTNAPNLSNSVTLIGLNGNL
jgi:hypothetical protein